MHVDEVCQGLGATQRGDYPIADLERGLDERATEAAAGTSDEPDPGSTRRGGEIG